MHTDPTLVAKSITTIRMLAADAVEKAQSGHPGLPMGAAPLAYALYMRHMRHNPRNPGWFGRDRFVLSAGHGSMLQYALLHLTGYDVSLDDIKQFRQWDSITPGHPEYGLTPGVEMTTGPLGQGFATGVGMALAERLIAQRFNRDGHPIIDYRIFGLVSDGDLMEGVAAEAASYAGHLALGNLVYLYLNNGISIEGSTSLTFQEDVGRRFEAYGWHVGHIHNVEDPSEIDDAITTAIDDPRPSLIIADTHIGYGSPNKQDSSAAHGAPLGEDELRATKEQAGWPIEPMFLVPEDVAAHMRQAEALGGTHEEAWGQRFEAYRAAYPDDAALLESRMHGELPETWSGSLPSFSSDEGARPTREASGAALQTLAATVPLLVGGSADLGPSNNTLLKDFGHVTCAGIDDNARNLHFGVREHAMGAITNGLALSKVIQPYCATFFVFTDYMRPAMRMAALMKLPAIYVLTHDSIGQGEDGATHQPIEHLASYRAMPNMLVLRPADANETVAAWDTALKRRDGPTMLVLTRQKVPVLDRTTLAPADGLRFGAYVLNPDVSDPTYIIIATGSEVAPALSAAYTLNAEGMRVRVVSMPSWELFAAQSQEYRDSVLPPSVTKRMVVEAGSRFGWERYAGTDAAYITIDHFGASAPGEKLFDEFGFTSEHIAHTVREHSKREH